MELWGKIKKGLGLSYDAAVSSKRRVQLKVNNRAEDEILKGRDRDKVVSDARNLRRNSANVAHAIRKHQDYVSTFTFRCRSEKSGVAKEITDALDDIVEGLMGWWNRPQNCDITGRFSLEKLTRIGEGMK